LKTPLLVLVALFALVSSVEAQGTRSTSTQTWKIGPDEFTMTGVRTFSGPEAAEYRANMDRGQGNGDGTLTRAEIDTWRQRNTKTYTEDEPGCFRDFGFVRLDGQTPLRISEYSVDNYGAAGSTSSQATVEHSFFLSFQYRAPASDRPKATLNISADASFYESAECYIGFSIGGNSNHEESSGDDGTYETVFLIHPLDGFAIRKDSVRPSEMQRFWDGKGIRLTSEDAEVQEDTIPDELEFRLQAASSAGTVQDVGAMMGYAAAGTLGLLAVAGLFTEFGRYHALKFLFLLPGFTRVQKDAVLQHGKREELYNFIKSNQGPSFSDLRRSLELSNGNLIHHLRILEMQGYVTGQRDGFRKRFYVRGPKVVPTTYLTRTQQQLLDTIGANPGLTQKELSGLVGLPRELVFYHTKQLAMRGRLEIKQDGNRRRYWLSTTASVQRPGQASRPT
jgi:DNA-binding MarR family transcriptional regulator